MGWDCSTKTTHVARKEYNCNASEWFSDADLQEWDDEDLEILETIMSENYKILKGTKYIHIRGKWDGEFCTFRARLDSNKLCEMYDLYQE